MNENIEKKVVKYLMNTANIKELEVLTNWLKDDQNKQIFKNYIRINYAMDINTDEFDIENAKKAYLRKIRQNKKQVHKLKIYKIFKYAAAAVIFFGLGYFFQNEASKKPIETTPIFVNNKIQSGTNKATLTLENGHQIVLDNEIPFQTKNANSNGKELTYEAAKKKTKKIAYNYLTIPRGGQFFVKLSDGTQVWLNSESQLKYPIAFPKGNTREVELVYGEAYFDVSPSTDHNGSKFKVLNESQEVEVYGTEFNIKAYKEDSAIYTTLVEGKVAVSNALTKQTLIPNQQSRIDLKNKKDITVSFVDVYGEISWKKGFFSFKSKSLKEIMIVLSRWYDFEVVFDRPDIENVKFNGVLSKNDNIEDILTVIKNMKSINAYEIKDKKIIIQ